jgi:hypothetical protein
MGVLGVPHTHCGTPTHPLSWAGVGWGGDGGRGSVRGEGYGVPLVHQVVGAPRQPWHVGGRGRQII